MKGRDKVEEAKRAAESWLCFIDAGNFTESWDAAAEHLKRIVTQDKFSQSLEAVLSPLGALESRRVKSTAYRTSLPGAPDGEYVVIQYRSVYRNKRKAVETITPMLEDDGRWRVSGYYIK